MAAMNYWECVGRGSEKLCTRYPRNQIPLTFETMHPGTPGSKPCNLETMHFDHAEIWQKSGITYQCLKVKIKPLTFQHENYVYCFHFQYPGWDMLTWYSNAKTNWWNSKRWKWWKLSNTLCLKSIIKKEKTKVVLLFVSLRLCYNENSRF